MNVFLIRSEKDLDILEGKSLSAASFGPLLPIEFKLTHPGLWMLVFAALLTLWSMGTYLKVAWPHLLPSVGKSGPE